MMHLFLFLSYCWPLLKELRKLLELLRPLCGKDAGRTVTNSYFIVIENVLFLLITVVLLLFNAIFSTNKLLSPCFVIILLLLLLLLLLLPQQLLRCTILQQEIVALRREGVRYPIAEISSEIKCMKIVADAGC